MSAWARNLGGAVRGPAVFLTGVNVVGAVLGLGQNLAVARVIGPELLGVAALVTAINAAALNFFDMRLTDLAGKLYYRTDLPDGVSTAAYRASVLQVNLLLNGIIALLTMAVGVLAGAATIRLFTSSEVRLEWLVAAGATMALSHWANCVVFLQRFSGRFFLIGGWKLAGQVVALAVFFPLLIALGGLAGLFAAQLGATVVLLAVAVAVSLHIWRREGMSVGGRAALAALPDYRGELRFFVFGNLLGYSKLLHRAADVLVVGYFCDDRMTGMYRLARTLTDGLYIVFDALNQVYLPRFLGLLSRGAWAEYRRLVLLTVVGAGAGTLGLLAGELLLLPPLIALLLSEPFAGLVWPVMALTVPFFFVVGVHLWLWPALIHDGRLGMFTACATLAAAAQYAVMVGLFSALGPTATAAAAGYAAYYLALYPAALALLLRARRRVASDDGSLGGASRPLKG